MRLRRGLRLGESLLGGLLEGGLLVGKGFQLVWLRDKVTCGSIDLSRRKNTKLQSSLSLLRRGVHPRVCILLSEGVGLEYKSHDDGFFCVIQ